jgi:hypothetical protein
VTRAPTQRAVARGGQLAPDYDRLVREADALRRNGAHDAALHNFHAITLAFPERSNAFSNLAAMLQAVGHPMPALQAVARALELDPGNVSALLNSAEILKDFGDWPTVAATYDAALALRPMSAEIRFARALALLTMGDWREGWREHEQRNHVAGLPLRRTSLTSPVWDGTALAGRHILLDHEQGLGDQIMFARFATDVAARGGRVTVRCSAPLAALFTTIAGVDAVSIEGTSVPSHDVHASLMSLPGVLGVHAPEALSGAPYLRPVGEMAAAIRSTLDTAGPRVGLVWAGNPLHRNDARRSVSPEFLAPLLDNSDISFVSLQRRDDHAPLLAPLPAPLCGRVLDLGPLLHDCNDTAHALLALDLLITVDTAVAHLAGALGVPTLLLVPYVPDWRWMLDRTDTPWYRSVTLVRQSALFEWQPVLDEVRARVATLTGRSA